MEVDYEEMIPLTSCEAALAEGAPAIHEKGNILSHEHLVRGNAEEVLENSAFVVTEHYSVPINEHAFMEPECAIAQPEGEGILLFSAGQSIYDEQREVARMLGLTRKNSCSIKTCWWWFWWKRRHECSASCILSRLVIEETSKSTAKP